MILYNVPDDMLITYKESLENYSDPSINPTVITRSNDELVKPKTFTVFRGHKEYMVRRYQWYDSHTYGGYIERVAYRFLRTKYGDFNGIHTADSTEYYSMLNDILRNLADKYDLHNKTIQAIQKHLRQDCFRP